MMVVCTSNLLPGGLAGGTPFVYQSCTQMVQSRSYMEGFFTFVEGTIQAPTGPQFDVQVRPASLPGLFAESHFHCIVCLTEH